MIGRSANKKGMAYIITAAFFFAFMAFFIRLAGDLPLMEKAFFRNAIAMLIAAGMLLKRGIGFGGFKMQKTSPPWLFCRCFFGTVGLLCNFWAVDHLVIADANILNKMSPFFAMIVSIWLLKEKPTKLDWSLIAAAFVGAVFVVKPTSGLASLSAVVGLVSGLGAGIAYSFLRKLGKLGERGDIIVFYFSLFSTLVCLPYLIFAYEPMTATQLVILLMTGVCGAGGQIFITKAYREAPAKDISVFDYSQVIFAAAIGFFAFRETPDAMSIAGYVIIIGAAVARWYFISVRGEREASV